MSGDNDTRYLRKIFRHVEVHLELVLVVGDLRLGGHLRVCHDEAVTGSRSVLCSVFTAEITARDCPLSSLQSQPSLSVWPGPTPAWLPGHWGGRMMSFYVYSYLVLLSAGLE